MLRRIGGAVVGVGAWIVVVTLLNLVLRHSWHDYATVERAMTFSLPMMIARLSMSGVSSLVGGAVARWIDKTGWAPLVSGVILLVLFLPAHYSLWDRFPAWYHLTFLASLPLLGWLGGRLGRPRPAMV
jgi:hypothetical protein